MSFVQTPVLVINLQRRPDRWRHIQQELQHIGLDRHIKRVEAVDGRALDVGTLVSVTEEKARQSLYRPRQYHEELGSLGAVGCYLSHCQVWKQIQESQQPALVVEDDAVFTPTLKRLLSTPSLEQVCRGFDLVLLGYSALRQSFDSQSKESLPLFPFQGMFFGLQFYYLTPQGASVLLRGALPIEMQVDSYMGQVLTGNKLKCAVHVPSLAQQQGFTTDIQTACKNCDQTAAKGHEFLWVSGALLLLIVAVALFSARRSSSSS